jgi:lysophospholipase L1-like esterase
VRLAAIAALASVLLPGCRSGEPRVRVACIGDSITAGSGIDDPALRYPAILGSLLGEQYDVRAFGVPGATMLSSGDLPYASQPAFREAMAFRPDVLVVALGTNDTKPWNWTGSAALAGDTRRLVEAFRRANPAVRVFLCRPPPVVGAGAFGIPPEVVRTGVAPILEQVARETGAGIVDLHAPLDGRPGLLPDGVHPGPEGARRIAEAVRTAITGP